MSLRKTWSAAVILCLTLCFGIVLGSVGTMTIIHHKFGPPPPNPEMRDGPQGGKDDRNRIADYMLRKMDRRLNLSDEQHEAIRKEMQTMGESFEKLHETTNAELDLIMKSGDERIRLHLTPEQIKDYQEFFENRRKKFRFHRDMRKHGPDDHRGPPRPPYHDDDHRNHHHDGDHHDDAEADDFERGDY